MPRADNPRSQDREPEHSTLNSLLVIGRLLTRLPKPEIATSRSFDPQATNGPESTMRCARPDTLMTTIQGERQVFASEVQMD
jgi:hypothetical protein